MEHFSLSEWVTTAALTVLAAVGGAFGYTLRAQDKGDVFSWRKLIVQFFSSGFVGFLVVLLCRAIGIDSLWMGPIVGVFGWMGATVTIQVLERFVYDRLGIDRPEDKKP